MPWLKVRLVASGRGEILSIAKVDSGATVTVLPRELVEGMGVDPSELEESGGASTAGGRVRTWRTTVPVELRVLADQSGSTAGTFGPPVPLHGVIGENRNVLLGQRDFFAAFDVLFDRNGAVPTFELRV